MDSIELFRLAHEYYQAATDSRANVVNKTQLLELYTLLKLAIIALNRILEKKSSVNSHLRIHTFFLKSEILSEFNVEETDTSNELIKPEYLLDEAKMIASTHESLLDLRLEAEFRSIKLLWKNKQHKLALKMIGGSIFAQTSIFKYLNALILIEFDPPKALNFLQTIISQNQIDTDPEIVILFLLMESNLALSLGSLSIVKLDMLQSRFPPLIIFKSLLEILYMLNLRVPVKQENQVVDILQVKLKEFAELISHHKQLPKQFEMSFNVFQRFFINLKIEWLNYDTLFSTFLLIFGVSNLNTSFEKRKALQLFDKNLSSIDEQLQSFNQFNQHLNGSQYSVLKQIKSQTTFYKIIEYSITIGLGDDDDDEFYRLLSGITDQFQILYLEAMKLQMSNKLNQAKTKYWEIISRLKQQQILDEICIFSCLNYLLIIESELQYKQRTHNSMSDNIQMLASHRMQILEILRSIETSNSLVPYKFLVKSSIDFISLLNNYNDLSTLQISEQASNIIDPFFDFFKFYPLFASLLLYLKSATLNDNSNEKQKSSQVAFNLSKFGNQLVVRYVCGLLNQSNSKIARNLQQYEIQTAKNIKIEQSVRSKYGSLFDD